MVTIIINFELRDYNRQRKQSPPRQRGGDYRNPKVRPDQNNGGSKNPKLPWQRPEYARPRSDFVVDNRQGKKTEAASKWDDYKKLAQAIENDMAKTLKQHEKNPEKHPQYNDEWKKFWNRRYKELQAEGKDAAKHDFKPEWIVFWNKRMVELHNNDVKAKKDALRKRYIYLCCFTFTYESVVIYSFFQRGQFTSLFLKIVSIKTILLSKFVLNQNFVQTLGWFFPYPNFWRNY